MIRLIRFRSLLVLLTLAGFSAHFAAAAESPTNIITQAADGSVVLLAKDATPHGTTIRYEPQPHKNTIGYWTRKEDWVSWEFKLDRPGSFKLELTQACGKGSGGSQYSVTIGTNTITDVVPDTGAFTNWVTRQIGSVQLGKAATYTASVRPITKPGPAVMDLRAIRLIPAKPER